MAERWRIKKGDTVKVITGKDKGKTGEITKVLREDRRVVVKGVNIATKHVKPSQLSAGGIQKIEASIHASNVMILDPKTDAPTRVGVKTDDKGKRVRFAKKSGEVLNSK